MLFNSLIILQINPLRDRKDDVMFGSQITLRSAARAHSCWLHSRAEVYPRQYADGHNSSRQQKVLHVLRLTILYSSYLYSCVSI